jgi:hypothetical protein
MVSVYKDGDFSALQQVGPVVQATHDG